MATERVQKPIWQPSSQKKQSPIVPPLIDSQTQADSLSSPKVPVSGVKSKAERDAIRRSLFEKWAGVAPQQMSESEVVGDSGSYTATETIQGQEGSVAKGKTGIEIQAKLTIGKPGDKYEQEADRVAAEVVQQMNTPASQQAGQSESVQREEMEDEDLMMKPEASTIQRENISEDNNDKLMKKEVAIVQREAMPDEEDELMMKPMVQRQPDGGMAATPDLEASINQARGSGQPLAGNIREPIEQAFGADFSGVKVHTDAHSDQLNQSIQARAFTTGQDIFFRQGEYNPGSRGGQELLAHELTHVVQQNQGRVKQTKQRKITLRKDEESAWENEEVVKDAGQKVEEIQAADKSTKEKAPTIQGIIQRTEWYWRQDERKWKTEDEKTPEDLGVATPDKVGTYDYEFYNDSQEETTIAAPMTLEYGADHGDLHFGGNATAKKAKWTIPKLEAIELMEAQIKKHMEPLLADSKKEGWEPWYIGENAPKTIGTTVEGKETRFTIQLQVNLAERKISYHGYPDQRLLKTGVGKSKSSIS